MLDAPQATGPCRGVAACVISGAMEATLGSAGGKPCMMRGRACEIGWKASWTFG